jgi:hypothetical protein
MDFIRSLSPLELQDIWGQIFILVRYRYPLYTPYERRLLATAHGIFAHASSLRIVFAQSLPQMIVLEGAAPQGMVVHQTGRPDPLPPPAKPAKVNYITGGAHQGQKNQRLPAQSPSVKYHSEANQAPRTQILSNQALAQRAPATQAPPGPTNQLQITGSSGASESGEEKRIRLKAELAVRNIDEKSVKDEVKAAETREALQKRKKEEEEKRESDANKKKAQREKEAEEIRQQMKVNGIKAAFDEDI